jgi:hypothetical protein
MVAGEQPEGAGVTSWLPDWPIGPADLSSRPHGRGLPVTVSPGREQCAPGIADLRPLARWDHDVAFNEGSVLLAPPRR